MMNSSLRLDSADGIAAFSSAVWCESAVVPGIRFRIARISVARRIELGKKLREIGRKLEFLNAGDDIRERLDAIVLAGEIDRAYLEWGLEKIEGLKVDSEVATPELLIERGPVELATEILERIKTECGLSGDEVKN